MTMKKYLLHILWLACMVPFFCSCSDWLTVQPKNISPKDKMFSSESGFQAALVGLYQNLQTIYRPTDFMMGGGIEYMANNYAMNITGGSTDINYMLYTHNYTSSDLDTSFGQLFQNFYLVITNANALLEGLEEQKGILPEQEAALIKGEALAIRAFCHFELIRLWGPSPVAISDSKRYLPYVTKMSIENYPYATYSEYMQHILEDFTEAETLLKGSDPIMEYPNSQLNAGYINIDKYKAMFWYYRQKRFNYYGVKALLARYYLWMGNKEQAYQAAKEVIDALNPDGTKKFTLGTNTSVSTNDYLFYSEHLIGLDMKFEDKIHYFQGTYVNKAENIRSGLYNNESDIRLNLFTQSSSTMFGLVLGTVKYSKFTDLDYSSAKSVPLIRLAEVYLIACETAPLDEANKYYSDFCTSRESTPTTLTDNNRQEIIIREYVKEFFSEEQSFFAYKRLGLSKLLLSDFPVTPEQYTLPIPTAEEGFYQK